MNNNLLSETLDYYSQIDSLYESSGYKESYELNTFWAAENMRRMVDILRGSDNAVEAIHSIQKTWLFSVNTSDRVKKRAVDWLLDEQKSRCIDLLGFNNSICESSFSYPKNNVRRKGRILTPDFLRTVNITNEIQRFCKIGKSRFKVLELGAGCGHLARTFRLFVPDNSYVIVDIPETLCFSYMFLTLNFPEAKTLYVTNEKQLLDHEVGQFDYVFVPTKFAENLLGSEFDLFVNTASLGEMKNSVIRYWMDFIQNRLKVIYLFSLNRYLNTIKTGGTMDWRLNENECSLLYDANWEILNWELEPPFTRCPYVDGVIARYLEIVAKRSSPLTEQNRRQVSDSLLSRVCEEDWVRMEKYRDSVTTCRDNILVNDMTMKGTLFKLWNSIRLWPNEKNVALMLKYLETLLHQQDKEFEEVYYYEDLFLSLFESHEDKELRLVHDVIKARKQYRKNSFKISGLSFYSVEQRPILVERDYHGFNIVRYDMGYHAFSRDIGPIDVDKIKSEDIELYRNKSKYFFGRSNYEVRHLIDRMLCEKLQKLQNDIAKFSEMIIQKSAELFEKNEYISSVEKDIRQLREIIDSQKANLADRDQIITDLRADIEQLEKSIQDLESNIEKRD